MNDLDLRAALHRDADLVGEPSHDLLDQLVTRRHRKRRQRAGLIAVAAAVVVVGAGIPVGASVLDRSDARPATTPSPSVEETTPPAVTPTPSAIAVTPLATPSQASRLSGPTAGPTGNSTLVLGPDGLGSLKLGMTRSQAAATGMVEPFGAPAQLYGYVCSISRLSAAPTGSGTVLYSESLGVETIDAYGGVQTPEGIGIGSPIGAVDAAYPGWKPYFGRGYIPVPGNAQATYRIVFTDGKVSQLTLQYANQNCYE